MAKKQKAAKKPTNQIRATKPNIGIAKWYQSQLDKLIKRMNRSVKTNIKAVWNKSATKINEMLDKLGAKWNGIFDDKATDIANEFVKRVNKSTTSSMANAMKDAGFDVEVGNKKLKDSPQGDLGSAGGSITGTGVSMQGGNLNAPKSPNIGFKMRVKMRNTREVQKVLTSLRDTQVNLITKIPREFHDKVAGIVQRGVQNGRDFEYIEEQLLREFELTPKRARMIANDQCNKATEAIKMTRDEMLGIEEGIWIHIGGRKTSRATHKAMNGKRFKLRGEDAGLYDEDVGEKVLPGQCVNCACTYRPVIPELDD